MTSAPKFEVLRHADTADYCDLATAGSALIEGDAHGVLRALPDGIAQSVLTSPPPWSLRDCGIEGQLGLEASVHDFIEALAELFIDVRRVLAPDGTLWLNLGDSYTANRTCRRQGRSKTIELGGFVDEIAQLEVYEAGRAYEPKLDGDERSTVYVARGGGGESGIKRAHLLAAVATGMSLRRFGRGMGESRPLKAPSDDGGKTWGR